MNRRDFLKRSIAAMALAAIALDIGHCEANQQTAKPIRIVSRLPAGRIAIGGNLFTGFSRGRYSVDDAEVRV
jgi:hypothetical protein